MVELAGFVVVIKMTLAEHWGCREILIEVAVVLGV